MCEKRVLQFSETERSGNLLKGKFQFLTQCHSKEPTDVYVFKCTEEYSMCGLVLVSIEIELLIIGKQGKGIISLMLLELKKINGGIVTVKFQSDELKVNNTYEVDDSKWRPICEFKQLRHNYTYGCLEYSFDVTIELNIKEIIPLPFASVHNDLELVDLELRGVDGSVLVHKAVLAGCSTVFRQELSAQYVQVQHATQLTLQQLKDFIYLRVLPDDMDKVVDIASFYKIEGLELQCIKRLLNYFTAENIVGLIGFATKYKMKDLLVLVLMHIQKRAISYQDIVSAFETF